jgi:quercetin dioxygenase-like cupin family protein
MKTLNIDKDLKYQKGSIVSKEIIRNAKGTVTLFAFDKGQGLSEHKAPFDALVNVVDGIADIFINGKKNVVKSGEMILMPANVRHALKAAVKFKMILTMIKD